MDLPETEDEAEESLPEVVDEAEADEVVHEDEEAPDIDDKRTAYSYRPLRPLLSVHFLFLIGVVRDGVDRLVGYHVAPHSEHSKICSGM